MENGWYDSTSAANYSHATSNGNRTRVIGNDLEFPSGAKVQLPPVNNDCYVPTSVANASRGEDKYFKVEQPTEYRVVNKYYEEKEDECGNVIEDAASFGPQDERLFIEKRLVSDVALNSREANEVVQLPPVNRNCYKSRSQSRNVHRPRRIESTSFLDCEEIRSPIPNAFEQQPAKLQSFNYAANNVSMFDISNDTYSEVRRYSRSSFRDSKRQRPRQSLERPPASVSVGIIETPVVYNEPHQRTRQSSTSIAHSKIGLEQIVQDFKPEQLISEEQQQTSYFPSQATVDSNIYWDRNENQFVQEPAENSWTEVSRRPPLAPRRESRREAVPFEFTTEPQQTTFTQEYQAQAFREAPVRRQSRHRSPAPTFIPQEPIVQTQTSAGQINENLRNILPPVNNVCYRPPSVARGENNYYEVNEPTEYKEVVEDVIVNDADDIIVEQAAPALQNTELINYNTTVVAEEPRETYRPPSVSEQIISRGPSRKIDIKTYFESFGHEENSDKIIEESLKDVLPPVNRSCACRPREESVAGDVRYVNVQEPTEYKNITEDVYEDDNVIAYDCNNNAGFSAPTRVAPKPTYNYQYQSKPCKPDLGSYQAKYYVDNQPVFQKMMNNTRNSEYYTTRQNPPRTNVRATNNFIQNLDYHDYDMNKASGVQNFNGKNFGSQMNVAVEEPHHTVRSVSRDHSRPAPAPSKNYEKLITDVINQHQLQKGAGHYQSMRSLNETVNNPPLSYNQMKFQEFQARNGAGNSGNSQGYFQNSAEIGRSVQNLQLANGKGNSFYTNYSRQYAQQPARPSQPVQYQGASQQFNGTLSPRRRVYHQSQYDLSNYNELQGPSNGFRSLRGRRD